MICMFCYVYLCMFGDGGLERLNCIIVESVSLGLI